MSYIKKSVGNSSNIPHITFECDSSSDLATINTKGVPMGSRCYVINEGTTYALNGAKEWKLVSSTSGSGGGGGGGTIGGAVIYDGGEEK
jgi:hypothetical protein